MTMGEFAIHRELAVSGVEGAADWRRDEATGVLGEGRVALRSLRLKPRVMMKGFRSLP